MYVFELKRHTTENETSEIQLTTKHETFFERKHKRVCKQNVIAMIGNTFELHTKRTTRPNKQNNLPSASRSKQQHEKVQILQFLNRILTNWKQKVNNFTSVTGFNETCATFPNLIAAEASHTDMILVNSSIFVFVFL
jgi:hypothetical protein